MSFLLDTDVASAYLRGGRVVSSRVLQHTGRLVLSTVSLGELKVWLYRIKTAERYRGALQELLDDCATLPVDDAVADRFGRLSAHLLDAGRPVPTPDLLIAATAMVHDLTLVTGNTRHFAGIPDLRIENWLEE